MSETPITDKFKTFMHGVDGNKYWVPIDCSRSIERIGRRAFRKLEIISEDCEAWLNNQCDETACEFIKKMRDYAKENILPARPENPDEGRGIMPPAA